MCFNKCGKTKISLIVVITIGIVVGCLLAFFVWKRHSTEVVPEHPHHCSTVDYTGEVSDYIEYYSNNCYGEVSLLSTEVWGERVFVRIEIDGVETIDIANENIRVVKEYSEKHTDDLDCLFQIVMPHVGSNQESDWVNVTYTLEASNGLIREVEFVGQSLSGVIPFDGVYEDVQIVEVNVAEDLNDEEISFFEEAYPNAEINVF